MPRLFFLNEEGSNEQSETLHLKKNTTLCKWSYIYLLPNVRDKLSPLEVQMTYAISEKAGNLNTRRNSEELKPIIGKSGQMLMISVSMFKVAFDLVYHILDLEFWATGRLKIYFRKPQTDAVYVYLIEGRLDDELILCPPICMASISNFNLK